MLGSKGHPVAIKQQMGAEYGTQPHSQCRSCMMIFVVHGTHDTQTHFLPSGLAGQLKANLRCTVLATLQRQAVPAAAASPGAVWPCLCSVLQI